MVPEVTWQSNPPEKLLKERFHISTGFHPGQRDIIEQLVQGKRLLVIQRTHEMRNEMTARRQRTNHSSYQSQEKEMRKGEVRARETNIHQ